ncbi:ACP phosphodiesterase [Pedobacter sp. AW31-3R]|uniref:ACP phosphodiesterase n=1 Tax=Pedobacter sp. AW31-3R TaxID=3445781 RepID=UPI003FA04EA5
MNFLSHFYFERKNTNDDIVMGVVLPDFIKNAHKDWNLNPQKKEELFVDNPALFSLLTGWKKHLEVDRLFHSSLFFKEKTALLKQLILPVLDSGPVKPFFLAHIGLELILDHLLLNQGKVNVNTFYTQLNTAKSPALDQFLSLSGIPDGLLFDQFLSSFLSSRYLLSYQKIENITYALNRICMRLWNNPFTEQQLAELTLQLGEFSRQLEPEYLSIFKEIEQDLKHLDDQQEK